MTSTVATSSLARKSPGEVRPSARFLDRVPREYARRHLIISAGEVDGVDELWCAAATPETALFNVRVLLERDVHVVRAEDEVIVRLIDASYDGVVAGASPDGLASRGGAQTESRALNGDVPVHRALARVERNLLAVEGKGPIVQLVDRLLLNALRRNASDLHVQPLAEQTLVRYRVDGVLHTAQELTPEVSLAVVSRIKVMGRMDIAERRVPQDGRATVMVGDSAQSPTVDLRISTLPTSYGERAVVRLLSNEQGQWRQDFADLGMPAATERLYLEAAGRSQGMLLVVGPTGSGKTTTLYTTLRWLSTHGERGAGELNITTVEDPIEYELSTVGLAISQTQVNAKKGVTFLSGLRYILRQDPDVIMVGEIRDSETARIAIQASLTGHLVFSTLHTKDAVGTVLRLIDLGIEPYLLAESLSAVLAQRLLRRRHDACDGEGCSDCLQTGLLGRVGIFELLPVTPEVSELIAASRPRQELLQAARTAGMRTLAQEGDRLVSELLTTEPEVRRVISAAGGER